MSWDPFHEFMPSCFHSLILHTFIECSPHGACHNTGDRENTSHPVCPQQCSPALDASPRPPFQEWSPKLVSDCTIYSSNRTTRLQVAFLCRHLYSIQTSIVCPYFFSNKNNNLIKSTFKSTFWNLEFYYSHPWMPIGITWGTLRYWPWVPRTVNVTSLAWSLGVFKTSQMILTCD